MASGIIKFIKKVCVQTAVYWGSPTPDGYGGKTFADPVELTPPNGVRWDQKVQLVEDKGIRATGEEIISNAVVLLNQDVDEQGYLYLGSLDDLDSGVQDNPLEVEGAYEIKKVEKIPLFRSATEFVRKAYL